MRVDEVQAKRPAVNRVRTTTSLVEPPSKYDVMNRPSQKVIDVGAALHRASRNLGLFKPDRS